MPKHRTAAVLLSFLLATTIYGQDADIFFGAEKIGFEYCKWMSTLARDVMIARQQDKPMSETLPYALDRLNDFPKDMIESIAPESSEDLDDVELAELAEEFTAYYEELKPHITQMVMVAYDVPTYSAAGNQRDAISDFENNYFAVCYKEVEEQAAASGDQAEFGASSEEAYKFAIYSRIMNRWVRPASATVGTECEANIRQLPGGEVVSITIGPCNGDAAVRDSIEAAILRASPLPTPDDPSIFESEVRLIFRREE